MELRCAEPEYTDDYRVMFSDNLRFARPSTRIIFAAEVLDLPIRRSEAELRSFLPRRRPTFWCATGPFQPGQSHQAAPAKPPRRALAGQRDTGAGTVHVGLDAASAVWQGYPYRAIKDGLRQEMATEWLADASVSYGEIAERLGFADVSLFYKAFRKWTGINPGHYRNLILAPVRG